MPRYCLDLDTPADGFIDSFLIGNGWLGATVKGGIGTERFDLNLDTVWSGGPLTPEEGDAPAPLLVRRVFGVPLITWTIRTPADREKAHSYADQITFEGFDPDA